MDRSAPVLRIGTLASRFSALVLLPWHRSDWFLQFHAIACIRFTPLCAGRRPPSHQAPSGLIPGELHAPGFDDACFLTTRLRGFTLVRLSDAHLHESVLAL